MRGLLIVGLFIFSLFAAQLVRIQGLDASAVAAAAKNARIQSSVPIPAERGRILSVDGAVLAASETRVVVAANQQTVCLFGEREGILKCRPETAAANIAKAAGALAPLLQTTPDALIPKLTGAKQYMILGNDVSALDWRKIAALQIPGIYRDTHTVVTKRFYPQGPTVASLIGYLDREGKPTGGVEAMANTDLLGTSGRAVAEESVDGAIIPAGVQSLTPAVDGKDVVLTLDSHLQWYAQNALQEQVQATGGLNGYAVVLDVRTGHILALATAPSFDNNAVTRTQGTLNNQAFSDVFEPGSTAKVLTMAAALEEGTVTPTTPIVIPNRLHRYDTYFKDHEDHGTLYRTVAGALAVSSNIGTMLVGETMSSATLERYFRSFGLGSVSGVGFPREEPGLLAPSAQWSGTQARTVMFGQGLSVTAIQDASVYQTIANGGVRVQPTLFQGVRTAGGALDAAPDAPSRRVVSAATAAAVTQMLESAASKDGTAPQAQIPGYRVAGKTGTAERTVGGAGYVGGVTTSFIGFAPADAPRLVCAVIIQRPVRGRFGATVAAPVFHDIVSYGLKLLGVPPTGTAPTPVALTVDPAAALADPSLLRDGRVSVKR